MEQTIYILALEQDKWYVGITNDIETRYNDHTIGKGSEWTKRYPPLVIHSTFIGDSFDEDKYTKIMMAKHGIDNVRGGRYTTLTLTDDQKSHIQQEIWLAEGRCLRCGSSNHFVKDCLALPTNNTRSTCLRCHWSGHDATRCYARKTKYGQHLDVSSRDISSKDNDQRPNITIQACNSYTDQDTINIMDGSATKQEGCSIMNSLSSILNVMRGCYTWYGNVTCSRCGKEGHTYLSCHETTHTRGWTL